MAMKKETRLTTARKVLYPEQYKEYKTQQETIKKRNLLQDINKNRRDLSILQKREAYSKTPSGRLGTKMSKGLNIARRGITQSLYDRNRTSNERLGIRRSVVRGTSGGRGRPSGTFDQRYAQYGGVYGYRKFLAQQRWKERQQILQNSVTNPRQREILNQIRAREESNMQSPERRTFPDTNGNIPTMRTIHSEINDYANMVD